MEERVCSPVIVVLLAHETNSNMSTSYHAFSSSMALRALVLSPCAMRSNSASSSSNLRFLPSMARAPVGNGRGSSVVGLLPFAVPFESPACVSSKSRTARSLSSSSSAALALALSSSAFLRAFSARFSSFFCVRMLARAHSRQKMSPLWHETGSRAIARHRPHEPKGRNESRFSRAELVLQLDFARARSWDVKTARDVFRLPVRGRENC